MNIAMILMRFEKSIVFKGMLKTLACAFIMVEPLAAVSREYNAVLFPGDIIEGWHQARENHYKFERTFIIGYEQPYDHYSSLQLFWPEEESVHINTGRITFFKCINRSPSTAKTLMRLIRGGTGTPELVVDVRYAPVQFTVLNIMTITCHIYTEKNDIVRLAEIPLWNLFDDKETSTQITPARTQTKISFEKKNETASSLDINSTTQMTTSSSEQMKGISQEPGNSVMHSEKVDSTTQRSTKSININKKLPKNRTSARTHKTTARVRETTPRTNVTNPPGGRTGQGINKPSSKDSQNKRINKMTSKVERTTRKISSEVTSPKNIEDTTEYETRSEDSTNERFHGKGFSTTEDETSLTITNPDTHEVAPQKSTTSCSVCESPLIFGRELSQLLEIINLICRGTTPGPKTKSFNNEVPNEKVLRSETEGPSERSITSAWHNLMSTVPIGLKKKIGLAKITY